MVIDIHSHLAYHKIYPKEYLLGMLGNDIASNPKAEKLANAFLNDKHSDKLVKQMDQAGIEKSILLIIDGCFGMSKPEFDLKKNYKLHYKIIKRYPNRFIVFAGIDPRRGKKGIKLFRKSVLKYGFRGLKLYPPMGFFLNDERLKPYLKICENEGLIVLIHGGKSMDTLMNNYAEPAYIIEIAKKYSNINFILAHLGSYMDYKHLTQMLKVPNIYADISGFQTLFNQSQSDKEKWLKIVLDHELNKKVLFGSDWPLFNIMFSIKDQIEKLKKLLSPEISETKNILIDNILFNNAKDIIY